MVTSSCVEQSGASLSGLALEAAPERLRGMWILHLHGNANSAFTSVPDRGAEMFPWLPVRSIPVMHARAVFGATNEPKRRLLLRAISEDGFGGHYPAAYGQRDRVVATMGQVIELGAR